MEMLVVDHYKSLGMMKWQFDLVLGLQNWKIIKPMIWWSILILGEGCMNCYFFRGVGWWHVACQCLHNRNTIETQGFLLQNGGGGKKNLFVWLITSHFRLKNPKFCSKKKEWCVVLNIISFTFLVTNYHPIVDRLYHWWWRCKHGSMKVWFFKDGLALDVCKHLRKNTNHNSSKKYWD
jgi:hypothetical protein